MAQLFVGKEQLTEKSLFKNPKYLLEIFGKYYFHQTVWGLDLSYLDKANINFY